ncbi:hypothetical protein [Nakamurella leprariae]|uniref:DedA family protein n=1 Tax=Nakamurella leprariae TaxID=2803911 RepID=A0A938YFV0_9ACTN|nr:hypothetical protein [Nakamurella leprariae]MBM9467617.1 hypothetical protein [Nakamurella leprariae]
MGDWLIDGVGAVPAPAVLALCALVLAAETALLIGVVLPAASALALLGAAVGTGAVPAAVAVPVAVTASLTGGMVAVARARRPVPRAGSPAAVRWSGVRRSAPFGRLERRLHRHLGSGAPSWPVVTVGHVLAGVRTLVPRLAGSRGIGVGWWAAAAAPGAVLWVGSWTAAGAAGAQVLDRLDTVSSAVVLALLVGAVLTLAGVAVRTVVRRAVVHRTAVRRSRRGRAGSTPIPATA